MDKEQQWLKRRLGYISASELKNLCSKSGKVTKENISYIRRKRFQRKHGFTYPVSGYALDMGKIMEHDAVLWFRENYPEVPITYSQELSEIPFWTADWAKFGASPDCFTEDQSIVVEIKNLVGNSTAEFFDDTYTPYETKKAFVIEEHGDQICGQFLSNDKVREVWVVKYIYQRDEVDEDTDSPLAPWRGLVFKFRREDFELESTKQRIIKFDNFIDTDQDPNLFK